MITLWAIREKATGNYLPNVPGQRTGWSHNDPEPTDRYPPRLFKQRVHAQICLTIWAKGPYMVVNKNGSGSFDLTEVDQYEPRVVSIKAGVEAATGKPRRREDFELVEFELKETTK